MDEIQIHVVRDGLELGVLPFESVRTLLAEGFLKATDNFRTAGMKDWQPLASLETALSQTSREPAKNLATKAATATKSLARQISDGTSALARNVTGASTAVTDKLLEGYLPRMQSQLTVRLARLGRASASALHDEEFLQKVFGALYDCLPKPVYRFVSEQQFIEFCHKHRKQLLGSSKEKPN